MLQSSSCKFCSECAKKNVLSRMKLFQIGFDSAVLLCNKEDCIGDLAQLEFVNRKLDDIVRRPKCKRKRSSKNNSLRASSTPALSSSNALDNVSSSSQVQGVNCGTDPIINAPLVACDNRNEEDKLSLSFLNDQEFWDSFDDPAKKNTPDLPNSSEVVENDFLLDFHSTYQNLAKDLTDQFFVDGVSESPSATAVVQSNGNFERSNSDVTNIHCDFNAIRSPANLFTNCLDSSVYDSAIAASQNMNNRLNSGLTKSTDIHCDLNSLMNPNFIFRNCLNSTLLDAVPQSQNMLTLPPSQNLQTLLPSQNKQTLYPLQHTQTLPPSQNLQALCTLKRKRSECEQMIQSKRRPTQIIRKDLNHQLQSKLQNVCDTNVDSVGKFGTKKKVQRQLRTFKYNPINKKSDYVNKTSPLNSDQSNASDGDMSIVSVGHNRITLSTKKSKPFKPRTSSCHTVNAAITKTNIQLTHNVTRPIITNINPEKQKKTREMLSNLLQGSDIFGGSR